MELSEERKAVMSGWMLKSPPFSTESSFFRRPKALRPRWRRRYFVLYRVAGSAAGSHCLLYFKDKQQAKIKGAIDLSQARNIVTHVTPPPMVMADIPARLYRRPGGDQLPFFQLDTKQRSHDRTYFFLPESAAQMEQWVRHVSYACGFGVDAASEDDEAEAAVAAAASAMPTLTLQLQPPPPAILRHPSTPSPSHPPTATRVERHVDGDDDGDGGSDETYRALPDEAGGDGEEAEDVYRIPRGAAGAAESVYGIPPAERRVAESVYGIPPAERRVAESVYGTPGDAAAGQSVYVDDGVYRNEAIVGAKPLAPPLAQPPKPAPRKNSLSSGSLQQPPAPPPPPLPLTEEEAAAVIPVTGTRSALSRVYTLRKSPADPATSPPPPMPMPRRANQASESNATSSSDDSGPDSSSESDAGGDSALGYAVLDFSSVKQQHQRKPHGMANSNESVQYVEIFPVNAK